MSSRFLRNVAISVLLLLFTMHLLSLYSNVVPGLPEEQKGDVRWILGFVGMVAFIFAGLLMVFVLKLFRGWLGKICLGVFKKI